MGKRKFLYLLAAVVLGARTAVPADRVSATVNAAKTYDPISKYIYGGFIEHLGNTIRLGLWSEMIDDRKFF